jgi:hypothetical protein
MAIRQPQDFTLESPEVRGIVDSALQTYDASLDLIDQSISPELTDDQRARITVAAQHIVGLAALASFRLGYAEGFAQGQDAEAV